MAWAPRAGSAGRAMIRQLHPEADPALLTKQPHMQQGHPSSQHVAQGTVLEGLGAWQCLTVPPSLTALPGEQQRAKPKAGAQGGTFFSFSPPRC